MMNESKEMADSCKKRNGEDDDMSGSRKRKPPPILEPSGDDVAVEEENGSSEDDDDDDDDDDEEDSDSATNYGSNHEEIKIETVSGKIITLNVRDSDTIGSMKLKIQDEEGIPFDEQELLTGTLLFENNSAIIANLCIKKGSTLTLARKSSGPMTIFIKPLLGRTTFPFKVEPSYTINKVSSDIYTAGYPHDKLIFNETILEDRGKTLADFNIIDGSTLTLADKSDEMMKISVQTFVGKTVSLLVNPLDTIAEVKSKIQQEEHIPADDYALIFNKTVLGDKGTLFDFNIKRESTLVLMRKSRGFKKIFIETFTGEIVVEVKPFDTIADIKVKINCQTGIPCEEQELAFNDMILHNADTLDDLRINKESTLTLMRLSTGFMRISATTDSGKTLFLHVKPSDTIYEVKSKIQEKEGTLRCQQVLFFNAKNLSDSLRVADYNITENSSLYLDFLF